MQDADREVVGLQPHDLSSQSRREDVPSGVVLDLWRQAEQREPALQPHEPLRMPRRSDEWARRVDQRELILPVRGPERSRGRFFCLPAVNHDATPAALLLGGGPGVTLSLLNALQHCAEPDDASNVSVIAAPPLEPPQHTTVAPNVL